MPTLTVRNLDDAVVKRLRLRAAEHGRSAEAEHREILRAVLLGDGAVPDRAAALARLDAFRQRIAGRGAPPVEESLAEARADRLAALDRRVAEG